MKRPAAKAIMKRPAAKAIMKSPAAPRNEKRPAMQVDDDDGAEDLESLRLMIYGQTQNENGFHFNKWHSLAPKGKRILILAIFKVFGADDKDIEEITHFSMSLKDLRIQWKYIADELKWNFSDSRIRGYNSAVVRYLTTPGSSTHEWLCLAIRVASAVRGVKDRLIDPEAEASSSSSSETSCEI